MTEVIITVRGEHETRTAPEEGVVTLRVQVDGADRDAVVERVAALGFPLREALEERVVSGTVAEWSSDRVAIWSDRPWNADGVQRPLVHHGSLSVRAVFRDFPALSWWIGDTAETEGVHVDGVDWRLTPATRTAVESDVATQAVGVAVSRATAYASALGLRTVTPIELADVGLLSRTDAAAPGQPRLLRAASFEAATPSGGAGLSLEPQDIVVTAAVEARFSAR